MTSSPADLVYEQHINKHDDEGANLKGTLEGTLIDSCWGAKGLPPRRRTRKTFGLTVSLGETTDFIQIRLYEFVRDQTF